MATKNSKKGLGKGLDSLIPTIDAEELSIKPAKKIII